MFIMSLFCCLTLYDRYWLRSKQSRMTWQSPSSDSPPSGEESKSLLHYTPHTGLVRPVRTCMTSRLDHLVSLMARLTISPVSGSSAAELIVGRDSPVGVEAGYSSRQNLDTKLDLPQPGSPTTAQDTSRMWTLLLTVGSEERKLSDLPGPIDCFRL